MYKSEFPEPYDGFFAEQEKVNFARTQLPNNSFHNSVNYHDELSPSGIVETHCDIVMHPLKQTPDSSTAYQATDLHFIIRNGMNLPTSKSFIDCSNKTDVIQRTKRSLTGMLRASANRPAPAPATAPASTETSTSKTE